MSSMKRTKKPHQKALLVLAICVIVIAVGSLVAFGFVMYSTIIAPKEMSPASSSSGDRSLQLSDTPDSKKTPLAPDSYKGWKTYKSTRDGYTIKYPPTWFVIKETVTDGPYIRNMQFSGGSYPSGYINLRILRDPAGKPVTGSANLQPKAWYAKLGKETVKKGPVTFTPDVVDDYSFADIAAKKAKSVFTEIDEDIFFLHESDMYEINMYPYGATKNATVKKILASFKLL